MTIKITLDQNELIPVFLGEDRYLAKTPKALVMMKLATLEEDIDKDPSKMLPAIESLVKSLFVKKDAKKVLARLSDPEDALDMEHIMQVAEALQGKDTTSNPTT